MSKARAILRDLACVAWLICIIWGGLSATPTCGYDGENRGGIAYDGHFLSISFYDGNEVLPIIGNEKHLCSGQASFASFTRFLAAEGTMALSPYRVTTAGESFIRYESGAADFSRVTTEGGLIPRTYAAPASERLLPQSSLNAQYNLWSPEIPRVNAFQITPPAGTPIIGPRPVMGGLGNEVVFPMGVPPGSVGPVIPVPPH